MAAGRSGTTLDEAAVLSSVGAWTGRLLGTVVRETRRAAVSTTAGTAALLGQLAVLGGRTASRARSRSRAAAAQVGASTDHVRHELAGAVAPRRRRRWPWVLAGAGVAGSAGVVLALRRPRAPAPAPQPPRVQDVAAAQRAQDDRAQDEQA